MRGLFIVPILCVTCYAFAQGIGGGDDGGGGGGIGGPGDGDDDEFISQALLVEAARLASQTTFGMPYEGIVDIAKKGPDLWLEQQFITPASHHKPIAKDLITKQDSGAFPEQENAFPLRGLISRFAWWHRTMTAPDVVRQRVAYALSQFFVVSDRVDNLRDNPYALTSFYDLLLDNAFGNFRDLLYDVALSPAMGNYLSHVNNSKADPENNIFPDQNFAREVMQLFSIGLYELNIDGTVKLDANGEAIPTYDNDDIAEFSKVFTGLTYGGNNHYWGRWWFNHADERVFSDPMVMYEDYHEPGEKHLLNGKVVPANQSGLQDINDAIDNLFEHPNVGPFFAKHLIQRLVTSNPSPAYVERVARAFNGEGTGVRGDMKATLRAVLFDRDPQTLGATSGFGRLREPAVRIISIARIFNYTSSDGTFYNTGWRLAGFVAQHPLSSPSVFNFYSPNHTPVGEIANQNLVAPEFQITTATTVIGVTNHIGLAIFYDDEVFHSLSESFTQPTINLLDYEALAEDPVALVDRLDLVLTQGQMHQDTRAIILDVLDRIEDPLDRAKNAIYLVLISPDYAVED